MTMMLLNFFITAILLLDVNCDQSSQFNFHSAKAREADNLLDLRFVSRTIVPYGPDTVANRTEQPYSGYAYGMGAAEEIAYDYVNHYLYTGTEQGAYVIVVDYADPSHPIVTNLSLDLTEHKSSIQSMHICPEKGYFFVLLGETALLEVYETVKRSNALTPRKKATIELGTGTLPSIVLPNKACTVIAVGRENDGKGTSEGGITLVQDFDTDDPVIQEVTLGTWDDNYILRKGLHMPLTFNALYYWDELSPIADDIDFSDIRQAYKPGIFLFPKKLAWSGTNDRELLVNLQENNGLLRINVETATAIAVVSYGLKDHSVIPIDINPSDKTCNMRTYRHLFAMRNPDTIATLRYNDKQYVITANEGDSMAFRGFEDEFIAKELFDGRTFTLPNMEVPLSVFDPANTTLGSSAPFNSECDGIDCVGGARISVGSNAIDYESDPNNPIYYRMVLFGGRGWSIYELPDDSDELLKLVFDSGDAIETTGCQYFPWSHNSEMDEEAAPADNFPNNTLWRVADEELREALLAKNDPTEEGCLDRGDGMPGACSMEGLKDTQSAKEGSGVEQIIVGEACGRLVAVTAVEKNSIALLFDITELNSPLLKKVFHLSPATQSKSAGIAYNDGTIGDIDPENSVFLSADQSPTGRTGILFAGAMSGTVSFWEFDCADYGNLDNAKASSGSASTRGFSALVAAAASVITVLWGR